MGVLVGNRRGAEDRDRIGEEEREGKEATERSEPEPQVGSYTVVEALVFALRMPRICAMIRLTSAGV